MNDNSKKYYEVAFKDHVSTLAATDPELFNYFNNFAFDEVVSHGNLDDRTRSIVILAFLLGNQGLELYKRMLIAAYNLGVSVVEMKEVAYQAADYLGMGKAYPFILAINDFCEANGIALPIEGQSTTNEETRLHAGEAKQIAYFGERQRESWLKGPEERRHISKWLAGNCFGDVYTRKGLTDKEREMITFCFLAAQGGCEPQLTAHCMANMNIGNDKAFLYDVISQGVPYIGYPRTLNALTCIDNADKVLKGNE